MRREADWLVVFSIMVTPRPNTTLYYFHHQVLLLLMYRPLKSIVVHVKLVNTIKLLTYLKYHFFEIL